MHIQGRVPRCERPAAVAAGHPVAPAERGQALVEFAAVLLPVLLLIVAIIQFGLLFGANVSLTNAAREGARAGTIYVYDRSHTRSWNDAARCGAIAEAATDAFGQLASDTPYFSVTLTSGRCSSVTGETHANGDLTVSYCDHTDAADDPCPDPLDTTTTCIGDTREGCLVQVRLIYRSDIIVPFIGEILSTDGDGRFVQQAAASMVVN
ncbi:MAG TPA: TadE family protein [Candidatus Limnocylindria bacterium]|nr:TadE family protein [Candidatus Limnocylindria bacterium]